MTAKRKPTPDTVTPPPLRILKVGTCPSLSGASTLTYHVGYDTEIRLRVWENSGGGLHGREWVAWKLIEPALQTEKLTGGTLRPLFRGKSRNTPGFLLAVLKAEALVQAQEDQAYTKTDPTGFLAHIEGLIASDTDVQVPENKPAAVKPARKVSG